jgi:hypothetical protein
MREARPAAAAPPPGRSRSTCRNGLILIFARGNRRALPSPYASAVTHSFSAEGRGRKFKVTVRTLGLKATW